MAAFQEKIAEYRSQNVQVLGVSVDESSVTAELAQELGLTFPLLVDADGRASKKFDLYDYMTNTSAKAVALVDRGRLVYSKTVSTTEVPSRLAPWVDKVLQQGGRAAKH